MRRLVCLFAIMTLAACGATTDTGGGGGDASVTPGDPDAIAPPPDLQGCGGGGDCATNDPCMLGSCDPSTGNCVIVAAEDGTDCVVNGVDSGAWHPAK